MVKYIRKGPFQDVEETEAWQARHEARLRAETPAPALASTPRGVRQMILYELIDYDILRVIWWALLGVLLIGFALTGRVRHGGRRAAALRRQAPMSNAAWRSITVGPVWEGNQSGSSWAAAPIFAAWPPLYCGVVQRLLPGDVRRCWPLFIVSGRSRSNTAPSARAPPGGRAGTGRCSPAARCPRCLFGVAVGNVLLGVPFYLTEDLMPMYPGNFAVKFLGLLRPFALLPGWCRWRCC